MRYLSTLLLVATVSAQVDIQSFVSGLSPQCQAASASLMTSEFGTCANLMVLVNVLGATGSLLQPFNTWVDSLCSAAPCSQSTVSTAAQTVQSGCSADATKGVMAAVELTALVPHYPTIRNALCLEYKSNHTRCASSFLNSTEKMAGRFLTLTELTDFMTGGAATLAPVLSKAPKDVICNDCGHALITTLSSNSSMPGMTMPSSMPGMAMPSNTTASAAAWSKALASTCGASFIDGKIPDTVGVSGGPSTTTNSQNNNPAAGGAPNSANPMNVAASMTLASLCAVIAIAFSL